MAGIGIILAWFGYAGRFSGLNTVTGGNDCFVARFWPGRYQPTGRDSAGVTVSPPVTLTPAPVGSTPPPPGQIQLPGPMGGNVPGRIA